MTRGGTASYASVTDPPELVQRAVSLARSLDFELSCLPGHGRLLQVLAAGRPGANIGETGTRLGCRPGLAGERSRPVHKNGKRRTRQHQS